MNNASELLREGIAAARAKKNDEALRLLRRVTEMEPLNELAWLWLIQVVDTDEQRAVCLENLQAISPGSEAADRGVRILTGSVLPRKPLPKREKQVCKSGGPFGLSEIVPDGATLRMFSSVNPERPLTVDQALEEMDSRRENPEWLNEDFLGFINDQEEVVQFVAFDFEGDACHLDIPLTVEGRLSFALGATVTASEALSIVRSFYAGASARSIGRAFLTAPRERLSVADETAALPRHPPSESYCFLLDGDERVVCHVDPIGHTTRADILASGIIEGLPLRLVSVTELITEGRQSENRGGVPMDDGSRSKPSSRLTQCVDCGGQISISAAACPHCGRPRGEPDAQLTTPRCPTCNSPQIEKISASDKAGSALLLGIFSIGQISKTFRCRNCGYKW